jgi:PPOX class probable F420-dependent enzyme
MATQEAIEAMLAERRNVVVAAIGADGRPRLTANWFVWDGARFYVSTMRDRAKARLLGRDPRAQLLVDDATGFRCVRVDVTASVEEDLDAGLPWFRAIREKYGRAVGTAAELRAGLEAEGRVLLVFTSDGPPSSWYTVGLD